MILGSPRGCSMPKKIELEIAKASTLELKPGHKYIMIFPKDAKLQELQQGLHALIGDTDIQIFMLAVNDVNQYKIAELMQEKEGGQNE